jgi:hypothetical protein
MNKEEALNEFNDPSYQIAVNRYHKIINELINLCANKNEPLIRFMRRSDVPANDQYHLINAAHFFYINNLKPNKNVKD